MQTTRPFLCELRQVECEICDRAGVALLIRPSAGCGGGSVFPLADVQTIQAPSGALHAVGAYHDIAVYVNRLSDWIALPGEERCDFLANAWSYKGTHSMVYTDSDAVLGGPGASTWGWKAHGVLEDHDGNDDPCSVLVVYGSDGVYLPDGSLPLPTGVQSPLELS